MKSMGTPDNSLLDLDNISVQIFTAKPEGSCEEHCNLTVHYSAQTKLTVYEKQAVELGDFSEHQP
jgi:hypothetical protein